jgi:hypothetical protein
MRPWEDEHETLLAAVALYSRVMWGGDGEYCVRIEDPEDDKYLDWLIDSLSRFTASTSSVSGGRRYYSEPEAEEARTMLEALRTAAAAGDNAGCQVLLERLRTRFPMRDYPLPLWVLDVVMNLHGVVRGGPVG